METHHVGVCDVDEALLLGHREAAVCLVMPTCNTSHIVYGCWCHYPTMLRAKSDSTITSIPVSMPGHNGLYEYKMTFAAATTPQMSLHDIPPQDTSAAVANSVAQRLLHHLQRHDACIDNPVIIERLDGRDMDHNQIKKLGHALLTNTNGAEHHIRKRRSSSSYPEHGQRDAVVLYDNSSCTAN